MEKTVVAYVPVLHRGYMEFFKKFGEGNMLLIPNGDITSMIEYLWRDMRALTQEEILITLGSLNIFSEIKIADIDMIIEASRRGQIIMPEEDISLKILEFLPKDSYVILDSVFLRWNKFNVLREESVFWDREITEADFNSNVIKQAIKESSKSTDFWRQVGAIAFNEKEILLCAYNRHLPTGLEPYYSGDPRTVFQQGQFIEYSAAVHAEAALVAEAARRGISLMGSEMFITTFPCPPCANLLSRVGIKTLYVADGYSLLAAKKIFAESGIEIVKIKKPSSI